MKTSVFLIALSFFLPNFCSSQEVLPLRGWQGGTSGTSISVPYNPLKHIANKTTSSPFTTLISPTITDNHPDWIAAIEQACANWSQILSTPHTLTFGFYAPVDGYPLPSTTIAAGKAGGYLHDAGGSTLSNTYYNAALAQFLGASFTPPAIEIIVVINETPPLPWYTGTDAICPSGHYDLETALMHEICHTLGFETVTTSSGGSVVWAFSAHLPGIYDTYLWDNGTGDASGAINTYLYQLTDGTPDFTSFCSGNGGYGSDPTTSNEVFFDGFAASNVRVFTPSSYDPVRSLSHLDNSVSGVNLMRYQLSSGDAIHCPSDLEINILSDIGWAASSATVGTSNNITIRNSTFGSPDQVLDLGSAYTYRPQWTSSTGDLLNIGTISWQLKLYAQDGVVPVVSGSGYIWTTPSITLPSGHTWIRDINGRIQGILTVGGYDNHSPTPAYHESSIDIGVNAKPDQPIITVRNILGLADCSTKLIKFYAAGADHFQVYTSQNTGGVWGSPSIEIIPTGQQSYTITGLDQTKSYQFWVQAINTVGSSYSSAVTTSPCRFTFNTSPNPLQCSATLSIESNTRNVINSVSITSVQNPNQTFTVKFDGTSYSVNIDLSQYQLSQGVYAITVTDIEGYESSSEIQVY